MRYTKMIFPVVVTGLLFFSFSCTVNKADMRDLLASNQAQTVNGLVEGTLEESGIRSFKGVPFAAPPIGDLRWREPQPVANWKDVRSAKSFGPRAMQLPVFGDMNFRSDGVSEDCLYLNIWTPAKSEQERLPVLVYFYGGGFIAGDGSEPRYDGESMANKGIVAITINYRLGVFGFLAHPELTAESPHQASGNYGFLDQSAALRWVKQNIAAFGGDPSKITIAGESAGSMSVSAQMASPLSKELIAGAIGESGAVTNSGFGVVPLTQAEQSGMKFAQSIGANNLQELRNMPAQQLLEEAGKPGIGRFAPALDNYFFPEQPTEIFKEGKQAKVPLLAGWNSQEMDYRVVLGNDEPTVENFEKAVRRLYGEQANEVLKVYAATTAEEVLQAATDLAGDRFIAYSTWKWIDLHSKTGESPVYRYLYSRPRPEMVPEIGNASPGLAGGVVKQTDPNAPKAPQARGAVHSAEIEYALGNLETNKVYAWTPEDYKVSEVMQQYFVNFIKTGNPNGKSLPEWPAANQGNKVQVLHIDVNTVTKPEQNRARYELLDKLYTK